MATRFANPTPQFFAKGTPAAPLSGGKMYFYEAGSSLTPKDTYSDNALATANSNPVILSASGVLPNVFLDGSYRVILKDKNGVQQWDRDSINSIVDLAYGAWDTTIDYGVGGLNIVYASNMKYYISIQTPNIGNEPSVSPAYWKLFIDYLLESQTTVPEGQLAIGEATEGMTGLDTTPKGSIPVGNGSVTIALPVGANAKVLTANSGATNGIEWADVPDTARDYQAFTSSGTWTKPSDAQFVVVECWGAGGGGAANTGAGNAGGGSGGEYTKTMYRASVLGATESVTIGAGGAGAAAAGANNGSAGGSSSFGSLITAIGGNPGVTSGNRATIPRSLAASESAANTLFYTLSVFSQAGAGGAGGAGMPTIYGGGGGGGNANAGGASAYGGAGGAGTDTLDTAATAGTAPAGGGGGSGTSNSSGGGGAGARGEVRVWTW